MSVASDGRPQSVTDCVLSVNGCLTVGTQSDNCESTSQHSTCESCGMHFIHAG